MPNMLNAAQTAEFNEKGFTYARGLFAPDEVDLLTRTMAEDPAVRSSILDRRDGEGRSTRIALRNRAGDSVYGLAARCQRMVHTSAALLPADLLQSGRQRHDHQERRSLLRAARDGRRRCPAPRRRALRQPRQPGALRVAALRAGSAQGVLAAATPLGRPQGHGDRHTG